MANRAALFSMEGLVADVAAALLPKFERKRASLTCRLGDGSTYVRGDRGEVRASLIRLLALTLAGSAAGATIELSCERSEESRARITIEGGAGPDKAPSYENACLRLAKYGGEVLREPESERRLNLFLPYLAWSLRPAARL